MMDGQIPYARQHCLGKLRYLPKVQPGRQGCDLVFIEAAAQVAGATEATGDDARDAAEGLIGAGSVAPNGEGSSSGIARRWPAAAASMPHSSGEAFEVSVRTISSSTT